MKANVSKMLRSALSMVLALCLIIGMCPAAFAAEEVKPSEQLAKDVNALVEILKTQGPGAVDAAVEYITDNADEIRGYVDALSKDLQAKAEELSKTPEAAALYAVAENLVKELETLKGQLADELIKQNELLAQLAETSDEAVKAEILATIAACEETIEKITAGIAAVEEALAPVDAALAEMAAATATIRQAILDLDNIVVFELDPAIANLIDVTKGAHNASLESAAAAIAQAKAAVSKAVEAAQTAYATVVEAANAAYAVIDNLPAIIGAAADEALVILTPVAEAAAAYVEEKAKVAIAKIEAEYGDEIAEQKARVEEQLAALEEELAQYSPERIAAGAIAKAIELYGADVEAIIAALEAKKAELENAAEEAIPGIKAEIAALEEKLADAQDKLAVLKGEVEASAEEVQAIAEAKIAEIVAELEARRPEIEAAAAKAMAEIEAAMQAEIAKVEEAIKANLPAVIAAIEAAIPVIEKILTDAEAAAVELQNMIKTAIAEAVAAVETLINNIVTAWQTAYTNATTDNYLINADSKYVALGDATVVDNKGASDNYAELLLAELKKDGHPGAFANSASADVVFAENMASQIASVEGADLVTVGLGNVTFLKNAIDEAITVAMNGSYELYATESMQDWSVYAGEFVDYQVIEPIFMEIYEGLWLYEGMDKATAGVITAALEAYAYSVVSYATQVPEMINDIRAINNDAVVILVGMYNPLDGVSIKLPDMIGGATLDIGEYIDILVEAASVHGKAYSMLTGNAIYVDTPVVETNNQDSVVTTDLLIKGDALLPSATGHKQIQTYIYEALGLYNPEVYRVYGRSRYFTAIEIANTMKGLSGKKFENVVVASGVAYADALTGTSLAIQKNAPILLVTDGYEKMVSEYIAANMAAGGTIYVLGDEKVISADVVKALSAVGTVKCVASTSRFRTNLEILKETNAVSGELLITSSEAPYDALSASSSGLPIMLVGETLRDDQKAYLAAANFSRITILGDDKAVAASMEAELAAYCADINRVGSTSRYATSVAVADYFYGGKNENVVLACGINWPDALCGGPLAAMVDAPVVLTDNVRTDVDNYVKQAYIGVVLGSEKAGDTEMITDAEVVDIFELFSTEDIVANPFAK